MLKSVKRISELLVKDVPVAIICNEVRLPRTIVMRVYSYWKYDKADVLTDEQCAIIDNYKNRK